MIASGTKKEEYRDIKPFWDSRIWNHRDEIKEELHEVDVVVGIGSNSEIVEIVSNALNGKCENRYGEKTHWAKDTLIREAGL